MKPKLPKGYILWVGNRNSKKIPEGITDWDTVSLYFRCSRFPVGKCQPHAMYWGNDNHMGDIIAYKKDTHIDDIISYKKDTDDL